jgi:hypothetical protein
MANLENTKKVLDDLLEDAKRMTNLAVDVQDYSMKDLSKALDGNAIILLKIRNRILQGLKSDGVDFMSGEQ